MKPALKPITSTEHEGREYGVAEHREGDHAGTYEIVDDRSR